MIERMFDSVPDATVVAAIGDSARAENIACARRLAAIAELYERRQIPVEDGNGRELWRIDPWKAVADAQGITAAAPGAQLHYAICLHERLPKVAALFAHRRHILPDRPDDRGPHPTRARARRTGCNCRRVGRDTNHVGSAVVCQDQAGH